LSKALKENGGEIFKNSKVNQIIVKNGRTYGVEVEGRFPMEADAVSGNKRSPPPPSIPP